MRDAFFIEDLVDSLLGDEAVDVTAKARRFLSPDVVGHAGAIREAFLSSGRVKHVALERVVKAKVAEGIDQALHTARFRRHHHSEYRIEVAPLETLQASALAKFCRWLGTDDAARFHGWLTGWPVDGRPLHARQVQVARARKGDEFPLHVDMSEEGLAAVYNFSEPFGPEDGGTLYFSGPKGKALLRLPPLFNTLIVFRPRNAPHGVTKLMGPNVRFSVTAFFPCDDSL